MIFDDLFKPVNSIKGIGPIISRKLSDKGIKNKIDLILNLPSGAIDRRFCPKLDQLEIGKISTIFVRAIKYNIPRFRNLPNKVKCQDEFGEIDIVFFNSRENYIKQILPLNSEVVISGKVTAYKNKFQITNPEYVQSIDKENDIKKIMAKYSSFNGISNKTVQKIYDLEITKLKEIPEWHDINLIKKFNWVSWTESIRRLHNPFELSDLEKNSKYFKRLAYDEILSNFLIFSEIKKRIKKLKKIPKKINLLKNLSIRKNLPFKLTNSQEKSLEEITKDLSLDKKMMRVLQGDVGSGKTIVAMLSSINVVKSGYQVAFLCPTDLLAKQHNTLFKSILKKENINIELLSGKIKISQQTKIRDSIQNGKIDIIIGTHSLFQEKTIFKNLGFIVIDEQHKFGVKQRINLSLKGNANTDVLLMTATPIPRTLILTSYGEMDISTITEKPFSKTTTHTMAKSIDKIDDIITFVNKKIDEGDQVYWVCPIIDDSEKLTKLTSVNSRYNYLKKKINAKISLIHGSLTPEEKDIEMKRFVDAETKVIVSTTVIEVGIDNPNANTIIVENTERFGLSQLHQLRGRVGRGTENGTCLLLYSKEIGENGKKRIQILKSSTDGFYISEEDLKLRGFGDIIGYKQSGEKDFLIADPAFHSDLFDLAKENIESIQKNRVDIEERYKNLFKVFKKDKILNIIDTG